MVSQGTEHDITRTVALLSDIDRSAPPMRPFKCRFDLLYFHCRLIMLQEATRITVFLDEAHSSRHTNQMVAALRTQTTGEVEENTRAIQLLINRSQLYKLKRLEVE